MAQSDPRKWYMPGWRIEQRFAPGVLIGNWSEERHTFQKGNYAHNSTHRLDFRHYGDLNKPDVTVRREGELRNDGKGQDLLFRHHGNAYDNLKITSYDEDYNGRWREKNLPPRREYNGHYMAWLPEKLDQPLNGPPTNFGLYESKKKLWSMRRDPELYSTTYMTSYENPPPGSQVRRRCAIPRDYSSTLHPFNHVNENMILRSNPVQTVKAPENITLPEGTLPMENMAPVSC